MLSPPPNYSHIDDSEDAIPSELRNQVCVCKYADDCTVFIKIQRGRESKIQAVLDNLQRWANINNMSLNTTKTKDMDLLSFGQHLRTRKTETVER